MIVSSAVYWFRERGRIENAFIPFAFSFLSLCFMLFFPSTALILKADFLLKREEREEVVKMLANKQIDYSLTKTSHVDIPEEYANLSAGFPNVVVEQVDGEMCVLFYTYRGLTDNSSGFVYVPNEKVMTQFKLREYGNSIFYDPIEITKITDHWYFVANT
ncbi:hypothetical protein [Hymenobacter crusticola]|nr:hypothetical protein [Hymenobacter crusticola]